MTQRAQRRLAAVVSADVAGYSRLMGQDERGTLATLKAHRAELIDDAIASHGGRIVKTTGDGLLAEFPSVVAAVECFVAVQEGMRQRNAGEAEDAAVSFRVGIHLGDIIVDGDDIFGDGVNISARLQELGAAGGVAVSGIVYDYLDDEVAAGFDDLGERELKNIRRPVRVWQRIMGRPAAKTKAVARRERPSIAVLPFDNMSGNPQQEYFSDGITEDIITALSRLRWLAVISRHSTFAYKGRSVGTRQVGQELGAQYVVVGSVRKAGQRVRVTAQIAETRTGNQIWAQRYDRELVDIFELQDELAEAISANVDVEVAGSERTLSREKPPVDLDAWDYYHRGMWHLYKMSREEVGIARQMFDAALERAPDYANAHAARGYVAAIEALSGYCPDRKNILEAGLADAEHAIALDDRDSFNHFALGRVCTVLGHRERALLALEKSVALNPNAAQANYGLGVAHYWIGNAEKALPYLDRAIRLIPRVIDADSRLGIPSAQMM